MRKDRLRLVALVLAVVLSVEFTAFAVDSDGAAYFGGTAAVFGAAKDPVEGKLRHTARERDRFYGG